MSVTVLMQAPANSGVGGEITGLPSGTILVPNSSGQVVAQQQDVATLQGLGFVVAPQGQAPGSTYNTNAATSAATLSGANIVGATNVTLALTGALAAAAALTLPTVANLLAALPNAQAGQTWRLRIINKSSGAFAWTVTTNTGWTLNGTMSIAQNTWRDFIVSLTSLTAATLQEIGTGTDS